MDDNSDPFLKLTIIYKALVHRSISWNSQCVCKTQFSSDFYFFCMETSKCDSEAQCMVPANQEWLKAILCRHKMLILRIAVIEWMLESNTLRVLGRTMTWLTTCSVSTLQQRSYWSARADHTQSKFKKWVVEWCNHPKPPHYVGVKSNECWWIDDEWWLRDCLW